MRHCGTKVQITEASKHTEEGIIWEFFMQKLVGDVVMHECSGSSVKHISGSN